MKSSARIVPFLLLSASVFADQLPPRLVLDKIFFQVSSKQWVSTQTALLSVTINATLTNADLVKTRSDIMARLAKVAKGDWHLIEFNRSQDTSGLEKLYVLAQARVDQAALTDVYQNAKSVSIPGAKYEINSIEFKPSLEETQAVKDAVRGQLYQKVNDELTRINKMYPTQNYSLNNLIFVEGDGPVAVKPYRAKEMNALAMSAGPAPLAVSNELVLTALVEAASNRKQGN